MSEQDPSPDVTARLRSILTWDVPIPALESVTRALSVTKRAQIITQNAAICFDSNVFLNLGKGRTGADLVDYLGGLHRGPIILPSQVLLELWNNQLNGVEEYVGRLSREFRQLSTSIQEIDPGYSTLKDGAASLVESFQADFGHLLDENTRTDLNALLEMFSKKAIMSQVSRLEFHSVAVLRKRTKTPPGFKDEGDGDFFVWAEFLNGLLHAKDNGQNFDVAVLVTDDVKKDWSTHGTAHPILNAEVSALVGVPLHTMTLKELKASIKRLQEEAEGAP
jgi:hypothetical protein